MLGHRLTRGAVAAVATLALTLSACGSDSEDGGGSGGGDVTLTYAHAIAINSMDPHNSGNVYDYPYIFLAYDRLTYLDEAGEPQPMLATEWTVADDAKSVDFVLRDDVTFHDGTELTADVVKQNVDRMLEGSVVSQIPMVEGAEVVDDMTVRINLNTPSAAAIPALMGGFAGTMMSPSGFDKADIATMDAGAGPYVVVDNKGADGITYEKFDDYWDPEVQSVDEIVFKAIPDDETRLNAILSGAVDGGLIRGPQVERAEGAGMNNVTELAASSTFLEINMDRSEFGDEKVRQAIAYGIDRQEVADAAFGGACQVDQQLFNENNWAHNADIGLPYERDVEKAKQLLAEAGLADGFSFEMGTTPSPAYVTAVEVIQSQLKEIGVDVKISILEGTEAATRMRVERNLDANVGVDALILDPSVAINAFYGKGGYLNLADHDDPEINRLAAEAAATDDQEQRADLYGQIQEIVVEQALDPLVICFQEQTWSFQPDVTGFAIGTTGMWDFRNVTKG